MTKPALRTEPLLIDTMPPGVPYIIGNEAAERFMYYGMRTILVIFMTKYLRDASGQYALMTEEQAKAAYHYFAAGVYFFPILGAILADAFLGKYRTILYFSLIYCVGSFAMVLDHTRLGLFLGLGLIAFGSGGIKSCVSANVGDQFGPRNKHLLEKVFGWFYFSINFGSFFSTLLTPILLEKCGPAVAFGVPGVLMLTATLIYRLGRDKFVHIPPAGSRFVRDLKNKEGRTVVGKLSLIFVFVAVFWALYDQHGSSWVLQADKLDRQILNFEVVRSFEQWCVNQGWTWFAGLSQCEALASQIQAVNPLLIMIMIPIFTYVIYPGLNRVVRLTPLRKITAGLALGCVSFVMVALIERSLESGAVPSVWHQIAAFVVLTAAEVMVSVTCLEFSYTQAPPQMKSLVMGLYMLSMSLGNLIAAGVNQFTQSPTGKDYLGGAAYFWFFAGLILLATVGFAVVAKFYRERTYIQGETTAA